MLHLPSREYRNKLCSLCKNCKVTVPRNAVAHVFCTECTAARTHVGRRVAVYWPGDKRWFYGRIKKVYHELEEHIYYISYRDGAKLWHSFADNKIEILPKRVRQSPATSSSASAAPEEEHDQQEEEEQLAPAPAAVVDPTPEAQDTESISEQSTVSAPSSVSEKFAASLERKGVGPSVAISLGWHLERLQSLGDASSASARRKARSILSNIKTNPSLREQIEQTSAAAVFEWTFEDMATEDVRQNRKRLRRESVEWHTLPAVVTPGEMQKLREQAVEAKEASMANPNPIGRYGAVATREPEPQPEKRRVTFALHLKQTQFYTPQPVAWHVVSVRVCAVPATVLSEPSSQPPLGRVDTSFFGVLDAEVVPLPDLRDDAARQPSLPPPALAWETREDTRLREETSQRYQPPVPRIQEPRYQERQQRPQEPPRFQGQSPRFQRDGAPPYQWPSPRYYREESFAFSDGPRRTGFSDGPRRTGFSDGPRRTGFSPRF